MIHNRIIYKLFVLIPLERKPLEVKKIYPSFLTGLILILSFLLGCATGDLSSRTRGKGVYHTVERGQTVWRIAKTYGVDIRPLIRVNHLSDTKDLKVGQRLFIPGAERVLDVTLYIPPHRKGLSVIEDEE
ncbi:MAG: LysM peptidoglycan-binding domain-containing protein, partial [Nitrospinae bacterium]|nr:LysM peptidoglycan-binding domain-containing protein [Nitrospinota bacterium]